MVFPLWKNGQDLFLARSTALIFTTFATNMCLPEDLETSLQEVNLASMNDSRNRCDTGTSGRVRFEHF